MCLLALLRPSLSHVSPPGPAQPLPELAVPAHPGSASAWIPLLQSQLKNEVGRGNMVLSRQRAREGGLPWECSRAPGLAAALGPPHKLHMSNPQPEGPAASERLPSTAQRCPDHSPKHSTEQLGDRAQQGKAVVICAHIPSLKILQSPDWCQVRGEGLWTRLYTPSSPPLLHSILDKGRKIYTV